MSVISIIHFSPVEIYPPVQNLLNELAKSDNTSVIVLTTKSDLKPQDFSTGNKNIQIKRIGTSGMQVQILVRYFTYFKFYLTVLLSLFFHRPRTVLYFETLSAFPAVVYRYFMGRKTRLFIHYHEYTSIPEYERSGLIKYLYKIEKLTLNKADWISHTNHKRMELFKQDLYPLEIKNTHILPNYPPKSWYSPPSPKHHKPLRIVYVGSFGLRTMFVKEFAEWVLRQGGKVIWDIYSSYYGDEEKDYFKSLATESIKVYGGINYYDLPLVLKKYDVGVILYTGFIPNHIYSESNKLFEYITCGLDVWFPDVITGSLPFIKDVGLQKVIALDFLNLESFDFNEVSRSEQDSLDTANVKYSCELALRPLVEELTSA